MVEWAKRKQLSIAPEKSTITFFTPDKARQSRVHPQVFINGVAIPLDKTPKILGVRFDTHYNFSAHVMDVVKKTRSKYGILHGLAGTGWGCQKETLLQVYKTYVEPSINYGAAVWAPNISETSFNSLQRLQNRALRIATGCHSNASVSHLHHESKVTLVKEHLQMLSAQMLVKCNRISHPSNALVNEPSGPRRMKQTLSTKHFDEISQFLTNGVIELDDFKPALNSLHTSAVRKSIDKLGPNPLLGVVPPPIAPSEKTLSRLQRSTLSQLRSGQCHLLNDYKVLTGRGTSAVCPECKIRRHTVPHLFE